MPGRKGGHGYTSATYWKWLVVGYTGLDIHEVGRLNYIEYLTYRRDAFLARMSQTEAGQEYLDNAWRMEQTEPDRKALRKKLGKEEPQNGE